MKTLYLLRHAKSSWKDEALPDSDRPLSKRGRAAAKALARHLRANDIAPSLVLSSPARRTIETLDLIKKSIGDAATIHFDRRLYMAAPETLLAVLHDVGIEHPSIMLLGHNPGLERFALSLASNRHDPAYGAILRKFPTAGLAALALDIDRWEETAFGSGVLVSFVKPSDLSD